MMWRFWRRKHPNGKAEVCEVADVLRQIEGSALRSVVVGDFLRRTCDDHARVVSHARNGLRRLDHGQRPE